MFRELIAVLVAPFVSFGRIIHLIGCQRRNNANLREENSALLALGQRLYEINFGDGQLRSRIAALDEKIVIAEANSNSATLLRNERAELVRFIGRAALGRPTPVAGAEVALARAERAHRLSQDYQHTLQQAKRGFIPDNLAQWTRTCAGIALFALLFIAIGMTVRSWNMASQTIASVENEKDLADAVGWVMCGYTLTSIVTNEYSELVTGTGTCFAVSEDGIC